MGTIGGLICWNAQSARLALELVQHLNAIPLYVQITQIVGGVLSRTLLGGRAERNEYLLLHACHKQNYIAPDKFQCKFFNFGSCPCPITFYSDLLHAAAHL